MMGVNDALALVFIRNAFYRHLYYLILATFLLSIIVNSILIGVFVFLIRYPVYPLYFVADQVGRFVQTIPVSEPNMTLNEVMSWAVEAVQSTYSYNYINYRDQLQGAQKYFTNYGWTKYMEALTASNNLAALTQRKMIVLATAIEQPKLEITGVLGGAYAWRFQIPMLVTYLLPPYDGTAQFSNPLQVSVIVQRQPELQSYKGLGIIQVIGNMPSPSSTQPENISTTPG